MTLVSLLFSTYISYFLPIPFSVDIKGSHEVINPAVQRHFHHVASYNRKYQRRRFRAGGIRRFPKVEEEESWNGYFSARNFKTSGERRQLLGYKKNIQTAFKNLPEDHVSQLKSLEVRNEAHISRGMANSKKIIINTGTIETDNELIAILIHEVGHIVDLGKLRGEKGIRTSFYDGKIPVLSDDPSVKFYKISWESAKIRKKDSKISDFVSGYAMSNVFEDFSEHYLFYHLHGEKFRKMAKDSEALQKKYDFFKMYVFRGVEYQKGKEAKKLVVGGIWDATLVDYDLKDLIGKGNQK